jgi:uncharacterized protein
VFDLNDCPVVDNHTHTLDPKTQTLEPIWLARTFHHGMADLPTPGVTETKLWGASEDLQRHLANMGVVLTAVCQMAKLFNCAPTLEAVTAERNRLAGEAGFAGYAKMLYQDAGIVASVMDSGLPLNDPIFDLTPGRKLRLFQMDPLVKGLLKVCDSYTELLRTFQDAVERAIRQDGFAGIKSHPGELIGLGTPPVEPDEAARIFPVAKTGDPDAFGKCYMAVWLATMLQCQDLTIPLHIHTGFTGGLWDGPIANTDPLLLVPICRQPRFLQTRLILLHAGYPWIQHAGAMAHTFPHVWVDISWTTPWISQRMVACFRELIAMAPLSKLVIGSGGHDSPEISWLAGKMAKVALGEVMTDAVRLGLLCEQDAERTGRMILHDNAARLYGLPV